MSLEIDHVVFCVADLDGAAEQLEDDSGLTSVEGGRHAGHGTANRIVPLGASYLELVGIVAPDEIGASSFGQWVASNASERLVPHALCLRTNNLGALCQRLGLLPVAMSRKKPDGTELSWRIAGLEATLGEGLPFFIEWDIDPADHPGRAALSQATQASAVEVSLGGDIEKLTDWVGGTDGVTLRHGEPGVDSVLVRTDGSLVTL